MQNRQRRPRDDSQRRDQRRGQGVSGGAIRSFNQDLPVEEAIKQTADKLSAAPEANINDITAYIKYVSRTMANKSQQLARKVAQTEDLR